MVRCEMGGKMDWEVHPTWSRPIELLDPYRPSIHGLH